MAESLESGQGEVVTASTVVAAAPATPNVAVGLMSKSLRLLAVSAIAIGLIIRSVPLLSKPEAPLNTCDGRAYYEMALSLAQGHGFVINDPFLLSVCEGHVALGPSHHLAPGLPIIEALFVGLFGDGRLALVVPLILLSWLAVAFALWTTNDLFGTDAALLVGAAVSLDWTGSFYGTFLGYSENLVLIVIAVTLWAILRALRNDRFVLWAGLAAGIGYLSKASIGWFFIIAGIGGFVYRLMFRGWGVLRNGWYWGAVAIFAMPVAVWSYRNFSLFWDGTPGGLIDAWQTSGLISQLVANAFAHLDQLAVGLAGKLPVMAGLLLLPYVPFVDVLWRQLKRWREEEVFGLWLAIGLIFVLGWFFAAVFWVTDQTSLWWADNVRYVMPAEIAILWLIVRDDAKPSLWRWSICFAVLLAMSMLPPPYYLTQY
jgi:4-amino-4-deoxy-L-arabinose transferase-like glycosyltransferase